MSRMVTVVSMIVATGLMAPGFSWGQVSLDVMTFNIRTANGRDGENSWPHRKDLVVETIERFSPQVVNPKTLIFN